MHTARTVVDVLCIVGTFVGTNHTSIRQIQHLCAFQPVFDSAYQHSGTFPTVPDQSETGRQYNGLIEKSFLVFPACSRWSLCHLLVCLLVHGIFLESTLKMYQQIPERQADHGFDLAPNQECQGC